MNTSRRCKLTYCIAALPLVLIAFDLVKMSPNTVVVSGKSTGGVYREKLSDLRGLRRALQRHQAGISNYHPSVEFLSNHGTNRSNQATKKYSNKETRTIPVSSMWSKLKSFVGLGTTSGGYLNNIIPDTQTIRRIIQLKNEMDPGLRQYLVHKYNGMLSNLASYSEKMGIPAYVVDSLKVPDRKHDMKWVYIERLLQSPAAHDLLHRFPQLPAQSSPYVTNNIQSRTDEEELVSDQEPDATVNGHKKKYTSYGIRLPTRRHRPSKGEGLDAPGISSSPDRTGYEYSSYADQYGLYGHDAYETYGKGYDDYSTGKGYGGSENHNKGYGEYSSYRGHKGGGGKGHDGTSASYGHSTYYSPKGNTYGGSQGGGGYGHGGGGGRGHGGGGGHGHGGGGGHGHGGGGGHGHGGGGGHGHGGGGGYGGGGGGHGGGHMGSLLDPFSILGSLAFLTYLGLMFQQTLNRNNTVIGGRSDFDLNFVQREQPMELFKMFDSYMERVENGKKRVGRAVYDSKSLRQGAGLLEDVWDSILSTVNVKDERCRRRKICELIVSSRSPISICLFFKDALLEKYPEDKNLIENLVRRHNSHECLDRGTQDCPKFQRFP